MLDHAGCFPQGCTAFGSITPNVDGDESGIKDDSGMQDVQYTEVCFSSLMSVML